MRHLQDRVVVTGAGSGFGRLLVQGCVARGAKAVAVDLDPAAATETVAGLGGRRRPPRPWPVSVAPPWPWGPR